MNCAYYNDFLVVCSFLSTFGKLVLSKPSDHFPSLGQLKQYIEGPEGRVRTLRNNEFSSFLSSLVRANYWNKSLSQYESCDQMLVKFLLAVDKTKLAYLVENCGYNLLDTRNKLHILRLLLEAQLDRSARIKEFAQGLKPDRLRNLPLGRDANGNWYWKFKDTANDCNVIVKELCNEESQPYFQYVRMERQTKSLISDIANEPVKGFCDGSKCLVKRGSHLNKISVCCKCKSRWHLDCLNDTGLHYDQEAWQCPYCDQKDLFEALRTLVREE